SIKSPSYFPGINSKWTVILSQWDTTGAIVLPVVTRDTMEDICNTEARHTVDLQFAIDHRHGITAHFCGARLAPEGAKPVTKETFQLCLVERARCNLAPRERPQSSGAAKNPNKPSNARLAQKQTQ